MSGYGTSLVRLNHLRLADDRAMEKEDERLNPINALRNPIRGGFATPSFGTSMFRGGASVVRDERLTLADQRAMEREDARENPLSKGATPSTGLSQVRGGRKHNPKKWIQEATQDMKKGAFTREALKHNMTPTEFAKEVLANPDKYTLLTRRRANFVHNVAPKRGKKGGASTAQLAKFGADELKVHKEAHDLIGGAYTDEQRRKALDAFDGKEEATLDKEIRAYTDRMGREPSENAIKLLKSRMPQPGVMKRYGRPCPMTLDRAIQRFRIITGKANPSATELEIIKSGFDENGKPKSASQLPKGKRLKNGEEIRFEQVQEYNKKIDAMRDSRSAFERWLDSVGKAILDVGTKIATDVIDPALGGIPSTIIHAGEAFARGDVAQGLVDTAKVGVKVADAYRRNKSKPSSKMPKRDVPNLLDENEVIGEFEGSGSSLSDAREMGRALKSHLKKLHGGAYAEAFFSDELKPELAGGFNSGRYEGLGTKKGMVRKTARRAYETESESDEEKPPAVPAIMSAGAKKRKPSARNEIVKKVMKEKGLSLIEASKYVKAHNLY